MVVRSDSAGGTKAFTGGLRGRIIGFQVVARRQTAVSAAITIANETPTDGKRPSTRTAAKSNPPTAAWPQPSAKSRIF